MRWNKKIERERMRTNFTKHKDDIESILSSMDREHDKLQERIESILSSMDIEHDKLQERIYELENEVEKLKNGEGNNESI